MTDSGASLLRRFALVAAPALLVLAVRLGTAGGGRLEPALNGVALDFRVVYCGAEAVRGGSDPYTIEPLRSCEHRVGREPGEEEWAVTPLPLPGYAIALFVPLTLLPFALAKCVWLILLVLAFAFAAAAVAAIARLPSLAVAAVFAPTIGFGINLYYGEPVPLAIAALCASAYALERGAYRTAAALAVLASLEPHVALPAIVGLAVLAPRTRVALGLALLAGGALSLTALGSARTLEYVTTLLPIHAQAELLARDQFGLSRFLALAGVPARAALTLGGLSYLATMAYGVFAAGRLAATYERPAFVVLFPVAAAMLGGSFVHDVQIVAALPAAVLLAPYSRPARVALALLVVDWTQWWRSQLLPTFTGAAGAAALAFRSRPRSALRWLIGAPLLSLALLTALGRVPDREVGRASVQRAANAVAPPGAAVALRPNDSASRAWALRIALSPGWKEMSAHDIADKVPFWVALGLLLVAGTCRERGRDEA